MLLILPFLLACTASPTYWSEVPRTRLERLQFGANVSRWFRYPESQTAEHYRDHVTDDEMAFMRRMGIRHVRLALAPSIVMDLKTGELLEHTMVYVDQAIDRFVRHGIAVIVDLHNEDRAYEEDAELRQHFLRFWNSVAHRYRDKDPEWVYVELMNEPVYDDREAEWSAYQRALLAAVRRHAPRHTVVLSGPNWGGIDGLRKLTPVEDRNVVYSFHFYDPFPFTHQGATWTTPACRYLRQVPYPSSPESVAPLLGQLAREQRDAYEMLHWYGEERWNRARLTERFGQALEWGRRHGVPLYCGEFGVYPLVARPEHRTNWFRDFGNILATGGTGWAVWGWDEDFGLNRQRSYGQIRVDTMVAQALGFRTE